MNYGIYRHYKGGLYLVLGEAQHTETGEHLCIYVSLDGRLPGPRMRARPIDQFTDIVQIMDPDNENCYLRVPRFVFEGDKPEL